jgi:hypothetical protein
MRILQTVIVEKISFSLLVRAQENHVLLRPFLHPGPPPHTYKHLFPLDVLMEDHLSLPFTSRVIPGLF